MWSTCYFSLFVFCIEKILFVCYLSSSEINYEPWIFFRNIKVPDILVSDSVDSGAEFVRERLGLQLRPHLVDDRAVLLSQKSHTALGSLNCDTKFTFTSILFRSFHILFDLYSLYLCCINLNDGILCYVIFYYTPLKCFVCFVWRWDRTILPGLALNLRSFCPETPHWLGLWAGAITPNLPWECWDLHI